LVIGGSDGAWLPAEFGSLVLAVDGQVAWPEDVVPSAARRAVRTKLKRDGRAFTI
jgi:hypothetical protein